MRVISIVRPLLAWTLARWRALLLLFLSVAVPLAAFGALAEDVLEGELPWDKPVLRWTHGYATPARDRVMIVITRLGYSWGTLSAAILTLVLLLAYRKRRKLWFFFVAFGGAMAIDLSVKLLFQRARPTLWVSPAPETTFSFPSGHAMGSMALVASLAVLFWPTRARGWVVALGALFILLVGFSRVYLGVHYPSDVLAGWAASLAWVAGVGWLAFGSTVSSHTERSGG